MKGIAKLQDGWYRLTCSCGDEDHRADIEIENDKEFNNVTIYFHKYVSYVRRKFWERVKDAWRILWKKEITFESDFIIQDKEQIDGLIDILQEGRETIDGVNAIFKVQKTRTNAILPTKAYDTDAGFDVYASEDISLQPGETKLVNFGFRIGLKPGWEAQMRNKSGVVTKRNVFMKLGVGTIDCFSEDMDILTLEGNKRVQELRIGDPCYSVNENNLEVEEDNITAILEKGNIEVICIETDDGILEVTPNTPIYTKNGLKYASEIDENDEILNLQKRCNNKTI